MCIPTNPATDPDRQLFCERHTNSRLDRGWCWECAEETYGYDHAKRIFDSYKIKR
jgi:hypothetical protein